jgi:hypothetical protein
MLLGYRGVKGAGRVRIQVHCISGPCHPPQAAGGKVDCNIYGFVQMQRC